MSWCLPSSPCQPAEAGRLGEPKNRNQLGLTAHDDDTRTRTCVYPYVHVLYRQNPAGPVKMYNLSANCSHCFYLCCNKAVSEGLCLTLEEQTRFSIFTSKDGTMQDKLNSQSRWEKGSGKVSYLFTSCRMQDSAMSAWVTKGPTMLTALFCNWQESTLDSYNHTV